MARVTVYETAIKSAQAVDNPADSTYPSTRYLNEAFERKFDGLVEPRTAELLATDVRKLTAEIDRLRAMVRHYMARR